MKRVLKETSITNCEMIGPPNPGEVMSNAAKAVCTLCPSNLLLCILQSPCNQEKERYSSSMQCHEYQPSYHETDVFQQQQQQQPVVQLCQECQRLIGLHQDVSYLSLDFLPVHVSTKGRIARLYILDYLGFVEGRVSVLQPAALCVAGFGLSPLCLWPDYL